MSNPRAFVPRPRSRGVVSQEVDGETLLYVEESHQASCLNAPAARIWALCDGLRTLEQIGAGAAVDCAVVEQALREFGEAGLLENGGAVPRGPNLARRRMLGVGLAAIPVILMVTAPTAAHAGSPCTPNGAECGSGVPACCNGNPCLGGGTC
ncbi:MAG TPA: PqqD family protein [Candidatus Angelobacter sp.]|nr:PqqD family protein [Candidatus Angelobacter sp.]